MKKAIGIGVGIGLVISILIHIIAFTLFRNIHPKTPFDYPNSVWESQSDDPMYVVLSVGSNGNMTSEVIYNDIKLEFTNKIVSEVMYFDLINDEQKGFSVSHSFVINDEILKCTLRDDFEKVFSLDEPVNLSFALTKVSG